MNKINKEIAYKELMNKIQNSDDIIVKKILEDKNIMDVLESRKKEIPIGERLYRARKFSGIYISYKDMIDKKVNEKEFGPPPKDKICKGRGNNEKENYFYLARESYTALSEIRPEKRENVLIGEFKLKKEIKLLDFSYVETPRPECRNLLSFEFYNPHLSIKKNYKTSICLSNIAKELNYDGILYSSSQAERGNNVMLFEHNKDVIEYVGFKNYIINSTCYIGTGANEGEKFVLPNSLVNSYGYEEAIEIINFISKNK